MALKETRKATELLVVAPNELGVLARITAPLARNKINIECFTGYEWGTEVAFRIVASNSKKAADLIRANGFNVQETTVVLWQTDNVSGSLNCAATALAEARVNTYCAYSTAVPKAQATVAVFNTSDANRTLDVLNKL